MAKHSIGFLLVIGWAVIQMGLLGYFGIRYGGDSGRYLDAAEDLLKGQIPDGKEASYLFYDALIAFSEALGLREAGVIAGQVIISGLAAICMYGLGKEMANTKVGLIAAGLLVVFLEVPIWNVFLLTDSLFISLPIIATYMYARRWWLVASVLTLAIALLRPEGIFFGVAVALWLLAQAWQKRERPLVRLSLGAAIVALILLLPWLIRVGGQFMAHEELLRHYRLGAVIWNYEPFYLTPLSPLQADFAGRSPHSNELVEVISFVLHHPVYFTKLALSKLIIEVAHVRPYHDTARNLLIILTLYPIYALAMLGWQLPVKNSSPKVIFASWIALKMFVVMITFADWTGRFLIHVLPAVFLFAALYVQHLRPKLA